MRLRRWELVDTQNGEVFSVVSRHFSQWGAVLSLRMARPFLRRRFDAFYELQVRRCD